MIHTTWLAALLAAAAWTTLFSLASVPWVRGYRNFGWLACYAIGVAMFVRADLRTALATWAVVGIGSGVAYFAYEAMVRVRSGADAAKPSPRALLDGVFLWPIMLPEAIENSLSELGLLKAPAPAPGGEGTGDG